MTYEEDIEAETRRAAGREEKYLEAYLIVETLKLELDERVPRHAAGQPRS